MTDSLAKDVATFIGACSAAGGVGIALRTYLINSVSSEAERKRTSAVRAADEMETFVKDADVRQALRMIDWDSGYIEIGNYTSGCRNVYVGSQEFCLALRHHNQTRSYFVGYDISKDKFALERKLNNKYYEDIFSPDEQIIRDIFDSFLGRLERVETLIRYDVIGRDLFYDYFSYWIRLIGEKNHEIIKESKAQFSQIKKDILWAYIRKYKFEGVIRLFELYDDEPPKNWFR